MNKLKAALLIVVVFTVALSVAAQVSAWPWDNYVTIKVRVNGPKSFAASFKPNEIATIHIYDTKGNTETIQHTISYYESLRNSFAVNSRKQFFIDTPVTVKVTFRGSTKSATVPAGRPLWGDTKAVTIQL